MPNENKYKTDLFFHIITNDYVFKMLEYFYNNSEGNKPIKRKDVIHKDNGISENTFNRYIPKFVEIKILKKKGKTPKVDYYFYNQEAKDIVK